MAHWGTRPQVHRCLEIGVSHGFSCYCYPYYLGSSHPMESSMRCLMSSDWWRLQAGREAPMVVYILKRGGRGAGEGREGSRRGKQAQVSKT